MKLLWVGKAADGSDGGDEIYDRNLIAALPAGMSVDRVGMKRASVASQLVAMCRGIPHPRFRFSSRESIEQIRKQSAGYDAAVISLEALESYADGLQCPTLLILHNIHSDGLGQIYPHSSLAAFLARWSKHWEKRVYGQKNLVIGVLSERDRKLLLDIAPAANVVVVPPGSPPAAGLAPDAQIVMEALISGSYSWAPKRRDVQRLAQELSSRASNIRFVVDRPLPQIASSALQAEDYNSRSSDGNIRFGLIPDTFISGFKLKATYYIANNFICLTRCDIASEFDGIPDAERFVRYVPRGGEAPAIMEEYRAWDAEDLRARFGAFKEAVLDRFTWRRSAEALAAAVEQLQRGAAG